MSPFHSPPEDLLHRGERIIADWMRAGHDEVEAFARFSQTRRARLVRGSPPLEAETSVERGLAVRAFRAGRTAFRASSWDLPDPAAVVLPPGERQPTRLPGGRPGGVPEPASAAVLPDLDALAQIAHASVAEVDVIEISVTALQLCLANSNGLAAVQAGRLATLTARRGMFEHTHVAGTAEELEYTSAARAVCELHALAQNAREVELAFPALLAPAASCRLLALLADALRADRLRNGLSFLTPATRLSPELNVEDDPERAPLPSAIDGEGTPVRRLELIREGRLTSFIYDCSECARWRNHAVSTGHSIRHSYLDPPAIGVHAPVIRAGGLAVAVDELRERACFEIADLAEITSYDRTTGVLAARALGWSLVAGGRSAPAWITVRHRLPALLAGGLACGDDPASLFLDTRYTAPSLLLDPVATR